MYLIVVSFTHPTATDIYTLSLHDALPISYASSSSARSRHARGSSRWGAASSASTSLTLSVSGSVRPRRGAASRSLGSSEIGRASCRERGEMGGGAVGVKEKEEEWV